MKITILENLFNKSLISGVFIFFLPYPGICSTHDFSCCGLVLWVKSKGVSTGKLFFNGTRRMGGKEEFHLVLISYHGVSKICSRSLPNSLREHISKKNIFHFFSKCQEIDKKRIVNMRTIVA